MIARLLAKIFGTKNERQLKLIQPLVDQINKLEPSMQALSDSELAHKTIDFRQRIAQGQTLDDILCEAYAVVREASRRTINMRHYDVQLIGGIALHQNSIAEMKTGEGKTLVATLPLYLNALEGKGAHLVTVNDYLARRDAEWMKPIYEFLGLSVGILQNSMDDAERQAAYGCDILYATNNELGFDYLRDNMKYRLADYVQRDLHFAIVDEVDSILIDEARTPLIISGQSEESSKLYDAANRVVKNLQKNLHYTIDEKERNVTLTEEGVDAIEGLWNIKNLYALENIKYLHHATQALRAHALFKKDFEYVVRDGEVLIVDEFTGRILPGRRYSDGLHQAIEAKEGVEIESESQTLAAITLQNFFRQYKKLAGMTGTASTEAEEFHRIYNLDVLSIPTNKPIQRIDKDDLIFLTKNAKYKAIVQDVIERHKKGQPVLIGTVAIETSELISAVLSSAGIPHDVLNAKQHAREAEIVEHAGQTGRVTIATNMAGRGTDIKISPEAREAGGLYILGTERHESRRIDNQLRGRSGRQGDPGESRFYISMEDDLIVRFAGDSWKNYMQRFGMNEDEVIEHSMVSRAIENSQEKVEKRNFDVRKHLLEYDDVLNQQRQVIYTYRRSVLEGSNEISDLISDMIADTAQDIVGRYAGNGTLENSSYQDILKALAHILNMKPEELEKEAQLNKEKGIEALTSDVINYSIMRYELFATSTENIQNHDAEALAKLQNLKLIQQQWVMLETIDQSWKQHMIDLDALKEGIGLRQWGQKTPLIEYKREAFTSFQETIYHIRLEIVMKIFRLGTLEIDYQALEERRKKELEAIEMTGPTDTTDTTPSVEPITSNKVARNAECPCGSGKKYKKCCSNQY